MYIYVCVFFFPFFNTVLLYTFKLQITNLITFSSMYMSVIHLLTDINPRSNFSSYNNIKNPNLKIVQSVLMREQAVRMINVALSTTLEISLHSFLLASWKATSFISSSLMCFRASSQVSCRMLHIDFPRICEKSA